MWTPFTSVTQQWVKSARPGRHAVGRGLWLRVDPQGLAFWELSFTRDGLEHDVELGTFPEMGVRQARKAAAKWRGIARRGLDPAQQQEAFRNAAARDLHQFYC